MIISSKEDYHETDWKSMNNQEPLGDMPNEVNHGLFSLAASAMQAGLDVDVLDFQAYDMYLRKKRTFLSLKTKFLIYLIMGKLPKRL